MLTWLGGTLVQLAGFIRSHAGARRLIRRSVPFTVIPRSEVDRWDLRRAGRVAVRESDQTRTPFGYGVFRCTVVLPRDARDWPGDRLHAVLVHELAHISRLDGLWLIVTGIATAVYWWHPAIWYAAARAREESERACDDVVLRHGASASDYASLLLLDAQRVMPYPSAAVALPFALPSAIGRRIAAVLSPTADRRRVGRRRMLATTVATAAATTLIGAAASRAAASSPALAEAPRDAAATAPPPPSASFAARAPAASGTVPNARPRPRSRVGPRTGAPSESTRGREVMSTCPSLARAAAPGNEDTLIGTLRSDADSMSRCAAARALGRLHDVAVVPALANAVVRDSSEMVRVMAMWALGWVGTAKAPAAILDRLASSDDRERRSAAWALSRIRDPSTADALRRAITHERDARALMAERRALLLAETVDPGQP